MPPHLDLSHTYTHGDMLLSARSPRMSLRRAASYNSAERGPQSSTSSRFSLNYLMASPPPSPSLPALIPRHGKPAPKPRTGRYIKGAMWLAGVFVISYYGLTHIQLDRSPRQVGWATNSGNKYEMVGETELPDFPTPVMITDKRGRAKWTVSIPPNQEFPLEPEQYSEICSQNMEVSHHVADLHNRLKHQHAAHFDYYHVDPYFMDVAEAEEHGLLPGVKAKTSLKGKDGHLIGVKTDELIEMDVCEKSMTFVLETYDAGLGKTLMMLWTAYGLARKEGRSFFIDDSRWAYGSYTNLFQAPPLPPCRPPPRHEMLPCPHHARHLVVSAATAAYSFGGAFNEYYENPKKMEVYRQRPMFDFARAGYKALFHINMADLEYATKRILDFHNRTTPSFPEQQNGIVVGVHIRHGDRRPYEFQYRDSYVPLDRYSDKAKDLLKVEFNGTEADGEENVMAELHSLVIIASDDPDVYESEEFSHTMRAQEQIKLASAKTISAAQKPTGSSPRKFIDESVGWEGGFFSGMFWSLGKPNSIPASAAERPDTKVGMTEEVKRLRELVGRAYILDLMILGRSDRVVCTVSSLGCRLLAVMMGWEAAVEKKGWVNIDGDFEWRGIAW